MATRRAETVEFWSQETFTCVGCGKCFNKQLDYLIHMVNTYHDRSANPQQYANMLSAFLAHANDSPVYLQQPSPSSSSVEFASSPLNCEQAAMDDGAASSSGLSGICPLASSSGSSARPSSRSSTDSSTRQSSTSSTRPVAKTAKKYSKKSSMKSSARLPSASPPTSPMRRSARSHARSSKRLCKKPSTKSAALSASASPPSSSSAPYHTSSGPDSPSSDHVKLE